jgi:hypothetical protein
MPTTVTHNALILASKAVPGVLLTPWQKIVSSHSWMNVIVAVIVTGFLLSAASIAAMWNVSLVAPRKRKFGHVSSVGRQPVIIAGISLVWATAL